MSRSLYLVTLFLFSLFLGGCEESYPVYASTVKDNTLVLPCLHYAIFDKEDLQKVEKAFGLKEDPSCAYRAQLIKYSVGTCNNPVIKSTGGDFNGYVRVEVKKGFSSYYKVQSDYKTEVDASFQRVLKKIASLHIKK